MQVDLELLRDFNVVGLAALSVMFVVAVGLTKQAVVVLFPQMKAAERLDGAKRTIEYKTNGARIYNELVVHALPYVYAALFSLSKSDFLFGKLGGYFGRLTLAFFVATCSAQVFRAIKKTIPKLFGVEVSDNDVVFDQSKNIEER